MCEATAILEISNLEEFKNEWERSSEDSQKMAKQIVKLFAERGFTIYDAKETLRNCQILLETSVYIKLPPDSCT